MNRSDAQLLQVFRDKIKARGCRGIMGLGRLFKIFDDDSSKSLGHAEFKKAVNDFRVGLNDKDIEKLFKIFDSDNTGTIDYEEFLRGVRGEMNEFRKAITMRAFKIMDKSGNGTIDITDIRGVYNAKKHPEVIAGKKTEDQILFEFLDTFELHHSDNVEDKLDGSVTPAEWIEYYNHVSMSIDEDNYFEVMMNTVWNLKNERVTTKGWGGQY
jgi:Ca2+-binding EF-hand superfamily protein